MKKKIIIFDFDGTLWDTKDIILKYIHCLCKQNLDLNDIYEFHTHNIEVILQLKERNHELKDVDEMTKCAINYHMDKLESLPFFGMDQLLTNLAALNRPLSKVPKFIIMNGSN